MFGHMQAPQHKTLSATHIRKFVAVRHVPVSLPFCTIHMRPQPAPLRVIPWLA